MTRIELMKIEEIDIVAKFISEFNIVEESYIGYCGKYCLEITQSLREDIE